jgi:hypothetical protein
MQELKAWSRKEKKKNQNLTFLSSLSLSLFLSLSKNNMIVSSARSLPRKSTQFFRVAKQRYIHHDLKDSCRLRGMPSAPLTPSSSECLESRIDRDVDKPVHDFTKSPINSKSWTTPSSYGTLVTYHHLIWRVGSQSAIYIYIYIEREREREREKSIPSDISFVLWRRKVPARIVTNPHISVTTWVGLCLSQSWK